MTSGWLNKACRSKHVYISWGEILLIYSDFSRLYVKRALVLLVRQGAERSFSSLCNSIESFHASSNPAIKLSRKFSSLILPWAPIHALWYTVNSCSYLAAISLIMRRIFCVSPWYRFYCRFRTYPWHILPGWGPGFLSSRSRVHRPYSPSCY